MFFLGVLAVLQIGLLPGLTIVRAFKVKTAIEFFVSVFGLSILMNFFLIFGLTSLGLYRASVMWPVIVFELVTFLWTYRNRQIVETIGFGKLPKAYKLLVFISGVLFLLLFKHWGEIFSHSDALLSWNRWAQDWASNRFPHLSHFYPQLIPANWSVPYVLIGDLNLQIFSKAIMPFFVFFLVLSFFDLSFQLGSRFDIALAGLGFLVGVVIDSSLRSNTFWFDTADLPATFLGWLAIYFSFLYVGRPRTDKSALILSAIFSGAACCTKQSGYWIFLILPFFTYYSFSESLRPAFKSLAIVQWGLAMIIFLPWNCLKIYSVFQGHDWSEVHMITQETFQGASYVDRVLSAIKDCSMLLGNRWLSVVGLFFLVWGCKGRESRLLSIFIFVPYLMIWALFFSYDRRNISLLLPSLCYIIGAGLGTLGQKFFGEMDCMGAERKVSVSSATLFGLFFVLLIGLGLSPIITVEDLIAHQDAQKFEIGIKELNHRIRDAVTGGQGRAIATNYHLMKFLPGLKDLYVNAEAGDFLNLVKDGRIGFYLLDARYCALNSREIHKLEAGGYMEKIFEDYNFSFFRKPNGLQ